VPLGAVDIEARSVALSFASEQPVSRWFGNESLVVEPGAANLGRLRDGGALLVNHDPAAQIGVVSSVSIGSDRVARATVRFSQSAQASEILQDVADGIRSKVSFAYTMDSVEQSGVEPDGTKNFRVTAWTPYELLLVSIPADPSVGIGRGRANSGNATMLKSERRRQNRAARERAQQLMASAPAEDWDELRDPLEDDDELELVTRELDDGVGNYERFRVSAIERLARQWRDQPEVGAIAAAAIESGATIKTFRSEALAALEQKTQRNMIHTGRVEPQPYGSLPREQVVHGRLSAYDNTPAGIERAFAAGQFFKSLAGNAEARQWCAERGMFQQRVLTEGIYSSAGVAVPDLVASDIIRNVELYGLARRLARNWPMSSASLVVPARTGGISTAFVGETDAVTPADPTLTGVNLVAKELAGATRLSNNAFEDAAPNLADFIVLELAQRSRKSRTTAALSEMERQPMAA
jgi:HK97 family phage major capsid protein